MDVSFVKGGTAVSPVQPENVRLGFKRPIVTPSHTAPPSPSDRSESCSFQAGVLAVVRRMRWVVVCWCCVAVMVFVGLASCDSSISTFTCESANPHVPGRGVGVVGSVSAVQSYAGILWSL